MDSSIEAASGDPAAATFSQVVFTNVPRSYPISTSVTCNYTVTPAFQPHNRDWVGWSSAKEYHTFVWVEPCLDSAGQETLTKQAIFKDYYLPKDDEFYQFCYIDSTGQVRGASTPFCFLNPGDRNQDSPDDDLLVITTQEQVEQSVREKAELMKELELIRAENETLKNALHKERHEVENYKVTCQKLTEELQQSHSLLAAEREASKNVKRRAEALEMEMPRIKEQLEKMAAYNTDLERKSNKFEALKNEIEELQKTLAESPNMLESAYDQVRPQQTTQQPSMVDEQPVQLNNLSHLNPYMKTLVSYTPVQGCKMCHYCRELFPGITQQELELHEQSHKVCPFCTIICDNMEQREFEDHVYGHEL
ncbi:hypothetical protein WMY93_010688 [Mugilogobius chulae]|uniref:SKICH domain-containing protein n=1 Tax=Mugilogobius chulae TaxID=88201 RepID=A0AAW0PIG4_9GOBI